MTDIVWSDTPDAERADICHARLRALAESEQPIRIRYGDTFTDMLLADPRTREKAHLW